jgi:hypothetical protein
MADLIVSNINITPSTPRQGKDMIQIEVTVKNADTAALPKVCSLSMDLWNQDTHPDYHHSIIPWYTNNIPQLSPGAEIKISKTITILYAGRYLLNGVIITEGLQIGDENPQNNGYERFFQVIDPPAPSDLVLESLMPTDDGRIRMKMYNKGASVPDVDFNSAWVQVKVNDTIEKGTHLKDIDPTGILKKGESGPWGTSQRVYLEYIWPGTGPGGIKLEPGHTYKVYVALDQNARISETDRSNNVKTVIWGMTP